MYSEAYKSYDTTNQILSFSRDSHLRELAARELLKRKPRRILDVATGTGEMAIKIAKEAEKIGLNVEIIGFDSNRRMLSVAKNKTESQKIKNIKFRIGNTLNMAYPDRHFDAVSCSFSVKNFDDMDKFMKEVSRVLKKNGTFTLVDMSIPENFLGKVPFYVYLTYMKVVGVLTGKKLYRWLPGSTSEFSRSSFEMALKKNHFTDIKTQEYLFGIAYIINSRK